MKKGFWAVPRSIAQRRDLSFKAKLIAGILWSLRDSNLEASPSRKYLAQSLGCSTEAIDRGIKELKERAGLRVKRQGLTKTNLYFIPQWDPDSRELTLPEEVELASQDSPTLKNRINNLNNQNNRDGQSPSYSPSSVREIIAYFKEKTREIKGFDPEISWPKEGALVKQRLRKFTPFHLKDLINWYLESRVSERLGSSLSVILSNSIINLWKEDFNQRMETYVDGENKKVS
jgi:hypothetical protein